MLRLVVTSVVCFGLLMMGAACGGAAEPSEQDIWYSSNLRPGRVAPESEGERELLVRLDEVPSGEAVALGGQVFTVDDPYAAASGRVCRSVTVHEAAGSREATEVKLACQEADGWVWVPDVFDDARVAGVAP